MSYNGMPLAEGRFLGYIQEDNGMLTEKLHE
jgi:hypothetical protein